MRIYFLAALLTTGAILTGCQQEGVKEVNYADAERDLFVKSNQCAASEVLKHLLPEIGKNNLSKECIGTVIEEERNFWPDKKTEVVLGGYGQSVSFVGLSGHDGYSVQPPSTLMIASLANVDNMNVSSTLGRVISEQVAATFTRNGYRMRELKLGTELVIQEGIGEMMLTREGQNQLRSFGAQAVVAGTYATSREFVYVNLKVIHPQKNVVLAVHDYTLPMDRNVRRMLQQKN